MKKLSWVRTGLLLFVLIFAVIGGNFLYTGKVSAPPLEMAAGTVPLSDGHILVQTFSPEHAKITAISLALQPPGPSATMPASSGTVTVILSDHNTGARLYQSTVALEGVPDCWFLDFPVNCRLDTDARYDFSVYAENYEEGKNPFLYCMPQNMQIPEITGKLTELPRDTDTQGGSPAASDDSQGNRPAGNNDTQLQSLTGNGGAAVRLTYDILVPSRLAVFLTLLAVILLCTSATVLISGNRGAKKIRDITLGKFLAIRIRKIPLIHILFFAAVTIAAVVLRLAFLQVKSNDFYIAYEVWINEIRNNGWLASLGKDIGDNPPLYMTLVTLVSGLPFEPVVIVKLPSILFDFILAVVSVKLSGQLGIKRINRKLTLYAVILLNPLTLLDSAAWGQCDSLYSSFVLLTLVAVCGARLWCAESPAKTKYAFWQSGDGICLLFAVALSLKLQAVFFLPVICLLWIMQKRNVLKPIQLLWVPIIYTVSCIPMFLAGRSLKVMFKIYLGQANRNYGTLTLNYPNLYTLIGSWSEELYDSYFTYGMLLAFLLLLTLFYQLYCRKVKLDSLTLCKVTALSVLTICFCLPLVHERYAYVAEMLLFVIMVKELKYVKVALATMLCTLFTYCSYLMQLERAFSVLPQEVIALVRLGILFYLAKDIFSRNRKEHRHPNSSFTV